MCVCNAASTADLNRDLLNYPASNSSSLLDARIQDAKALAERCATGRLPAAAAKAKLEGLETLDREGTSLWNRILQIERRPVNVDSGSGNEKIARARATKLLLNGLHRPPLLPLSVPRTTETDPGVD